jgi:4-hydroxy-tetrahydrodipicolinate reductase
MGRAIEVELAARGHETPARVTRTGGWEALTRASAGVAFEFTSPEAAPTNVSRLLALGIPVVCGTTGWDVEPARALSRERGAGFLHAPNFSLGVAALRAAVAAVARRLAAFPEYGAGIVERHHSAKKDAPSGTAKALAGAIGGDVPIVSLRHGGQPGEHSVVFEGPDESIELVHRARSRALFAAGAVRAAEWLVDSRAAGPVTFEDFLAATAAKGR